MRKDELMLYSQDGNQVFLELRMPIPDSAEDVLHWAIYDHPTDHPDCYVARAWHISEAGLIATGLTIRCHRLEPLQFHFERGGLTRIKRSPEDDPKIVEVWL